MQSYLEAHAGFVAWLDGVAECDPSAADVEQAMFDLAARAAQRGMTGAHWMFVVDGLIAHAKRRCPNNAQLPEFVARGVAFCDQWQAVRAAADHPAGPRSGSCAL